FEQYYPFVIEWHNDKHTTFVSDLFTAFAVLGATVTIGPTAAGGKTGKPSVYEMLKIPNLDKTPTSDQLPPDAVFLDFFIPYTRTGDYVRTYKVADREQDGQALVNAGIRVRFDKNKHVREAVIIFGGIGYNSVSAEDTGTFLKGKPWNRETLAAALKKLSAELGTLVQKRTDNSDNREYRIKLARELFYRFYLDIADKV
ncbi:MAG: hypothetical protein GY869_19215, partial [Planctomycetes bacterium]|nr:hypothetical protein [Planctomycetota bacterium]